MANIKGLLAESNAATDELVSEFQSAIFVRNSRGYNVGTTLFGLMSRLENEPADQTQYKWFERDPIRKTIYTQATRTSGDTTLDLRLAASGGSAFEGNTFIHAGTLLMNDATREIVRVTSAPSGGNAVITRSFGETAAAAVAANQSWTIVTHGQEEGALPAAAVYEDPTSQFNNIQTFSSSVYLTNAFKNGVLRTDLDGPLTDRRTQALERIGRDIEFAYFLGTRGSVVSSGLTSYYTGGILETLQAGGFTNNIQDGASITLADFNTWLSNVLPYGSEYKLAFCGPTAYSAISNYANSNSNGYRIMQNETVFGMHIQQVNTPFGILNLTQHPLFREATGLNDWMFVVDLPHLVQKVYEKLFLEPNIQTPGQDVYQEQFRAKLGLKLKFPQAFGVCYDLSAIS